MMDFSQLNDDELDNLIAQYDGQGASPMPMAPQFPTAPQMQNPSMTLDTSDLSPSQNLLLDVVFGPQAFKNSIIEGVKNSGRGVKQAYLQGTEALGLQPEGTTAAYTKTTDAARKAYEDNYLTKLMPKTSYVGELGGEIAPYMAAPAVGAGTLAGTVGLNALMGSGMGALQYVPEGNSRTLNAALGGVVGGALPVVGAGVNKAINAFRGGTEAPAAQKVIDAGLKHNVPVFASDASNSNVLKGVAQGLEDVPIIGIKGARLDQMQKAQAATENVVNDAKQQMLGANFGDKNGLTGIQNLVNSENPVRREAARSLLHDVENAGDDWQKIIETSGNLKAFQNKLLADQKYNTVGELANQFGGVNKPNAIAALDNSIKSASNSVLPDNTLINNLQTIRDNLASKDFNYNEVRQARSKVGSLIDDYYKGSNAITGSEGVGYLQSVKNGLDKDMDVFAQQNGPELKAAWKDADSFYKNNVVPFKDPLLAKAFTNNAPDEIYNKFITLGKTEGGKGTSRAQKFYDALDEKGQSAVRYGMVSNALESSINRDVGTFSPAMFASNLDKIAASRGVFFKGDAKAELDGFKNLMRHVERSKVATSKPETGIKAVPWIGAALGLGAHAAGVSTGTLAGVGGLTYGLNKLITTPTGRRLLLASSKLEINSPAMQKVADKTYKLLSTGAILKGSQFANMPPPSNPAQLNPVQKISDDELEKAIHAAETQGTPSTLNTPNQNVPAAQPTRAALDQMSNEEFNGYVNDRLAKQGTSQNQSNVSPALLNKIAQIESGGNPLSHASNGSASGLFQFTNGTWKAVVDKYGAQTGISYRDKNNPQAQRVMANLMLKDHEQALKSFLGRAVKPTEIYLTHFLGLGGAKQLLSAHPQQLAFRVLPDAARANRAIFFKNGRPLTTQELYSALNKKMQA